MAHHRDAKTLAVVGDVHGHLQLALCVLAEWQLHLGRPFSAVCLCGDVGTFSEEEQLDSATRRHARDNPCELEFLTQWAVNPQPPWIEAIFRPREAGGLGLGCPVIMVHGNHEGFAHLEELVPPGYPERPVTRHELPTVDSGGHILLLPSGWTVALDDGPTIAAVGGIEPGQRLARYHPMAYIDEDALAHLLGRRTPVDLLITHQGPARLQGEVGSPTLDIVLERPPARPLARLWCHGHSVRAPAIREEAGTRVVPLHDVPFGGLGGDEPGADAWALVELAKPPVVRRETPWFLRTFRRQRWTETSAGQLVSPTLAYLARGA